MAGLTRPVSGLLKLVRSMHTIKLANEKHLIDNTRILVNTLHQRIVCIHSCKPVAGLNIMHAWTGFRSTQICSSIACFRQPVAGINQNPSMHAFTAALVFSYTRNRAVTESGESSQPCADMYVHAVLRHIGPYMHIVSSCTKRLGALLNFISSAGNGGMQCH